MGNIDGVVKDTLLTVDGLGTGHVAAVEEMRGISTPFVVFTRQEWDEERDLLDWTGLCDASYDVDIVAPSIQAVAALERKVITAFRALEQTTTDGFLIEAVAIRQASPDLREKEIGQFRRVYDLQINYQEVTTNE